MKRIEINHPGKLEDSLKLDGVGMEDEYLYIVKAVEKGDYELDLWLLHLAKKTSGRISVRAVVKNGARLRIKGTIKIAKEAQNVDSFLDMRVLLLDGLSTAEAIPQLEIEANEVKASHAAAISQIDKEMLFYMASRGISGKSAENMIVEGFLSG